MSSPVGTRGPDYEMVVERGKIAEFVSDSFEKLKQQVEKDCRFRVVISRLEIGGYCSTCRGSQ